MTPVESRLRQDRPGYFPALEWQGVSLMLTLGLLWIFGDQGPGGAVRARMLSVAPVWVWGLGAVASALLLAGGVYRQSRLVRSLGNAALMAGFFAMGVLVWETSRGLTRPSLCLYWLLAAWHLWAASDNFLFYLYDLQKAGSRHEPPTPRPRQPARRRPESLARFWLGFDALLGRR
mgnify:CR=1 FL=1